MIALTNAFGLSREPFAQDISVKDLYPLPGLEPFLQRFEYAIAQRLVTVIAGEVGAGKSTSLRAAIARLHPAPYCIIPLVATSGSLMKLLRQICIQTSDPPSSNAIACMLTTVRIVLSDLAGKKQVPVLIIDKAHILRLDVFAQLHTLAQVD
jgi:general secretion pathway protein A